MAELNYTKGEWTLFGDMAGLKVLCDNFIIALVSDGLDWAQEFRANANLIAAAPKQHQALVWVAEWLGIRPPDGEKPNRADVIRIVGEALAKAEGGIDV